MLTSARRGLAVALLFSVFVSLSGCGTLFHPERKGQLPGRVDPAIAIADGLGLLLFIVPGVVAYAIDFSNNTIYLPTRDGAAIDSISIDTGLDEPSLLAMIETRSGRHVDADAVQVERPDSLSQALALISAEAKLDS